MKNKNIFDLDNNKKNINKNDINSNDLTSLIPKKQSDIKYKKKSYKANEIKEMLNNYINVNDNEWMNLPEKTHIRYLGKDGYFRIGGYIIGNYFDATTNERKFKLTTDIYRPSNNINNIIWVVKHNNIKKIWKRLKVDSKEVINKLEKKIEESEKKIELLEKMVESHKIEIINLRTDIQKLTKFIKNKH